MAGEKNTILNNKELLLSLSIGQQIVIEKAVGGVGGWLCGGRGNAAGHWAITHSSACLAPPEPIRNLNKVLEDRRLNAFRINVTKGLRTNVNQ